MRHAHLNKSMPFAADLYGDLLDTSPTTQTGWRDYIPGLLMTGVAALAAAWLSEHYGAPLMLMGLLIGLVFNFTNADARLHAGLGLASKTLLRWGIVIAGLQISFGQIIGLGWESFLWLAAMIAVVTGVGALTARFLGIGTAFGTLAGGAVAICGASAALAIAAVLGDRRATQAQLTLVLVAISAASAFAMSTYPIVAGLAGLSDQQAGFLFGASIHDVAQALGAGFSFSDPAGQTAAIVKLTRVAMLAPALAAIALLFPADPGQTRGRTGIPWFVLGFLAVAALNSLVSLPVQVGPLAQQATSILLLLAVTATGIRSPMQLLMQQGWRSSMPVVVATITAFALAILGAWLLAS